ncbi:uncharacterized protein KNAG_0E01530 [Huiozyma naganishii CBS 8797]|uniref:Uncharacterized protein n=1 Tax=Huiozyma naganishii (strain ATCC MYA-139 / BCRC 22969 / CBS 8797 / KCTC 17520 / NBRC 10181 / NCYC 3082 / Yp74L-3) TaxID=1071383 RepID=J7RYZ6_HUIN7|nr:hypothetical protein KNAG_0E01530 [Kazachstania naganishii CBS 8797]CCK70417.1 hypothetical protein KNAG_0E01530 [Kazachstania naganishii CBS 8797]
MRKSGGKRVVECLYKIAAVLSCCQRPFNVLYVRLDLVLTKIHVHLSRYFSFLTPEGRRMKREERTQLTKVKCLATLRYLQEHRNEFIKIGNVDEQGVVTFDIIEFNIMRRIIEENVRMKAPHVEILPEIGVDFAQPRSGQDHRSFESIPPVPFAT